MTDATPTSNLELVRRFAGLVSLIAERPSSVTEQRELVRGVVDAAGAGAARMSSGDAGFAVDGSPFDSPQLAERFVAYGIDELTITERAAIADVLDLARLLATAPSGADPASRFAARAAAIDAKAFPRRFRARPVVALDAAPPPPPLPPPPPPAPIATAAGKPPAASVVEAPPDPSARADEPERLTEALPVPTPSHPMLAAALDALQLADGVAPLNAALDQLVLATDLAFRQGRNDDLIEAMAVLVAIEFQELERDSADERRQAFNHTLRRLAKPVLLRQLAILRHVRAADPIATRRLQQVLYRYGTDGAEALIDEYVSAATPDARATCLTALRGLRRTHDALHALARDTRDLVVRHAAAILGDLRDARGEGILIELLQHPDARARRAAVASLGLFESASALEALGLALGDESPLVRLRAVAALTGRREPRVLELLTPLLDAETDREALFAAIGAVGAVGTPDAVQRLIRVAEGEGLHPLRKSAPVRIMGCTALVAIRSPTAMAAVQVLRTDRDRDVREASVRLVAQAQRRASTTVPAVSGP